MIFFEHKSRNDLIVTNFKCMFSSLCGSRDTTQIWQSYSGIDKARNIDLTKYANVFFITRDPYKRVESVYTNKILGHATKAFNNYNNQTLEWNVIPFIPKDITDPKSKFEYASKITFEEYVTKLQYVLMKDPHLSPQTTHYNLLPVNTKLVKMENDLDSLNIHLPHSNKSTKLKETLHTNLTRSLIGDIYSEDFRLLKYHKEEMLPDRLSLVKKFIKPDSICIELGVAKGNFSKVILENTPCNKLVSVDRWSGDRGHNSTEESFTRNNLKPFGSRSEVVKDTFESYLSKTKYEYFDFVYIDGYAHTGQESGKTLEDWWSKVKVGGVFAGHDYHPKWQPTIDAVDSFVSKHNLKLHLTEDSKEFNSWYIIK